MNYVVDYECRRWNELGLKLILYEIVNILHTLILGFITKSAEINAVHYTVLL